MKRGAGAEPRFFFGAMSPYSWFAAERIDELIPGARWSPLFVGGLFKAQGREAWGLTAQRLEKMRDCEQRAQAAGLGRIRWPDPWPTSDLLVARAMIFAERHGRLREFALGAMRAAFLDGAELGQLAAVQRVGRRVGLDPAEIAVANSDPDVKEQLRAATQRAVDIGVRGVPTVAVGEELFWGDDRLHEAASAIGIGGRPRE